MQPIFMQVYNDIKQLPHFQNAVITIGTFDGVHKGHQQVLAQLIREAKAIDGTAVVITFDPHPRQVIAQKQNMPAIQLLNTPEEKYSLLQACGIAHIVVVPFNATFASQGAREYVSNFLVAHFRPHTIIIGYDHKFGSDRKGDYHLLEQMAEDHQFIVKEIPEHVLQHITVSSTKIRQALLSGDSLTAAAYLGYPYFFHGTVRPGNRLGRTIGYPTANLEIEYPFKLVPGNGVYAVLVSIGESTRIFKGMMNIGTRPTVDGSKRMIEVNIFDFDQMIYDQVLRVQVLDRLRDEQKFDGVESLKIQLGLDKEEATRLLTMPASF